MSPFVLSVLKYSLLILLYFFVYRAVRAVGTSLSGGKRRERTPSEAKPARQARPARGSRVPTSLVLRSPEGKKLGTFALRSPLEIGRADACTVRPEDAYVSQFHARLYGKNGAWYVEDLGSTNGTYLNEKRVAEPAEVHAGDRVRVGRTILELRR